MSEQRKRYHAIELAADQGWQVTDLERGVICLDGVSRVQAETSALAWNDWEKARSSRSRDSSYNFELWLYYQQPPGVDPASSPSGWRLECLANCRNTANYVANAILQLAFTSQECYTAAEVWAPDWLHNKGKVVCMDRLIIDFSIQQVKSDIAGRAGSPGPELEAITKIANL